MEADILTDLPIGAVVPDIQDALAEGANLVLEAPPGAGKTTGVPLALLGESWARPGKIMVLEPRRLAARAAAGRMASLLGEAVGERVGYRVRGERKTGPRTLIEVVTTGLFLRQLQADPALPGVAAILFDEFHERTMDADLALALSIEAQSALRHDLRLIVMSATLDGVSVAGLLAGARIIRAQGKSFPVEIIHLGDDALARPEARVVAALSRALAEIDGDVLVFLPGLREIQRQKRAIEESTLAGRALVLALHGDMALGDQDRIVRGDDRDQRRIILATSIAETSLTIGGIGAVVDSGLKRRPRFDPVAGMSRLVTVKASLASAKQRSGRAGRTGPGRCYRLWSAASERGLALFDTPEIEESDLAPLALETAIWGSTEIGRLALLTAPPAASLSQAQELLRRLGAIDASSLATPHGRRMAELGAHPRIAHMMILGQELGAGGLACDIAAILSERDMFRKGEGDCDLQHRLSILSDRASSGAFLDRDQVARIRRAGQEWRRLLGKNLPAVTKIESAGRLLALAYPDRLAQPRGGPGQFRLANGRGAVLDPIDPMSQREFLAIGALDGDKRAARIFLAAPISREEIEEGFAQDIVEKDVIAWNSRSEAVEARRERRLWSLVLKERPLDQPPVESMIAAMLEGVRAMGLGCLPWSADCRALQARIAFLRMLEGESGRWPDLSDEMLLHSLEGWLAPYLSGISRRQHLQSIDLREALGAMLDWRAMKRLDEEAPTHLVVPSGSRVALDYSDPGPPILKVRLQEMFGALATPRVAEGRVEVVLHLLSPARRPVQVTRDLAGFWANSYRAVRADLRGQYPRHHWPDDPLTAQPTARAKPRGR